MADFYELDFLSVNSPKSGDAITIRYEDGGETFIHVVDGGYQKTGESVVAHIREHYGNPARINHVVATHNDGDHAGGLREVLENFEVGALWMHRPWLHAVEIIDRFPTRESVAYLEGHLRTCYPNLAALEEIALRRGIAIIEPFQGNYIGRFQVLAPSRERFQELLITSARTPEHTEPESVAEAVIRAVADAARKAVQFIAGAWGEETFSPEETSNENEMSVVQFATLSGKRILLTGDVGRGGLAEAADYADLMGHGLPGLNIFQVPHHGGRRNVSTEVLDRWLGPRIHPRPAPGTAGHFAAYVSASKEDEDHPRRSVIRAVHHRGGEPKSTENGSFRNWAGAAPERPGWTNSVPVLDYPADQEA